VANGTLEAVSPSTSMGPAPSSRRTFGSRVKGGLAAWLPALPLFFVAGVFLVLPVFQIVYQSLHSAESGWTLGFWTDTYSRNSGKRALFTSLQLGAVCATISLVVGGPLAWQISRMTRGRKSFWLSLMNVAANFGGIGLAFAYMAVLGTYGMLTLGLTDIGIPFVPPGFGSFASLVMAYEYANVPLYVLLTLPAMSILRHEWREAAEVASANNWQFWRHVGAPILAPFLLAGWLLIFTWSVGIYGLAYAMGANASQIGQLNLITLYIGQFLNTGRGKEERAAVMAATLLILAAVSLGLYRLIMKRALKWFS
jgi:putative spermidine/putrescine transport system permease protein